MKRRIFNLALILCMLMSVISIMDIAVSSGGDSLYYQSPVYNTPDDPTSGLKEMKTVILDSQISYETINDENKPTAWGKTDKQPTWYVVSGTASVEYTQGITVTGDVRLILMDGCNLTVTGTSSKAAIKVNGTGNSLTIYAGNTAYTIAGTGTLTAKGGYYGAGIGGELYVSSNDIVINGGTVNAIGGNCAAGIGGGYNKRGSSVVINGGTVTAIGGVDGGAGIGGGFTNRGSNRSGTKIYVAQTLVTKAGADENPTDVVENNGGDIASLLNKRYVTIIKKKLITFEGTTVDEKTYDGTTAVADDAIHLGTVSGIADGDDVTVAATATFDDADAGDDKTVTITYTLSGKDAAKYIAPDSTVYADISRKKLTVTGSTADGKEYDGTTTAKVTLGTVSGKITGDDVKVIATGEFADENAGTDKNVSVEYSLSGSDANNYIAPDNETVYADISPKQLAVTGSTANGKDYDGTTYAQVTVSTVNGIIDSEDVEVIAVGTFEDKNVGNGKIVTITYTLTGDDAGNYAAPTNSDTVADINKKALSIDAEIADKIYDGTTDAEVTNVTFDSLVLDETFELDTDYTVSAEFDNTDADGANAATKVTVTVTLISNEKTDNYKIYPDTIEVSKTIEKAEQTISSPTLNEKTSLSITLNEISDGLGATKYGVSTTDDSPDEWQDSTVFENLTPGTTYYFFSKYEGNDNYAEVISESSAFETSVETQNTFTVTWMDYSGSRVLEIDEEVPFDSFPDYNGKKPSRNSDFVYYYTFSGWSTSPNQKSGTAEDDLPAVTEDVTYYAAFSINVTSFAYLLPDIFGADDTEKTEVFDSSSIEAVHTFDDVAETDYYYDAVMWAYAEGITAGESDIYFNPDTPCTRAQMVTFMWRADGCPEPTVTDCEFTDVNADDYFYPAVLWAVENGITLGTSTTTFSPYDTCTRAQAVTFLYRRAGEPEVNAENIFTDVNADDYFFSAVLWAIENEITVGTTSTTFSPYDLCTRAHIITFIYRADR